RRAETLYQAAIDAIVRYQVFAKQQAPALPPYTADLLRREMMLFVDWLVCTHLNIPLTKQMERLIYAIFEMLIENAMGQPQVFVHRDFHSRNLMVTNSGAPGVLDFQDAVIGPITYDLVSLLKDCYIAWPGDKVIHWARMYRQRAASVGLDVGQTETRFLGWFDRMGVQRHLKASGIFARLWHRDGKRGYLADIPRTLRYIVEVGEYDQAIKPLADLISAEVLPALAQVGPTQGGAN
uniref:aminoglycoside phosphotransferase family protein n=1 Tax=Sedimenticola sp. TaxID=1940285 RepID=UPI003D143076